MGWAAIRNTVPMFPSFALSILFFLSSLLPLSSVLSSFRLPWLSSLSLSPFLPFLRLSVPFFHPLGVPDQVSNECVKLTVDSVSLMGNYPSFLFDWGSECLHRSWQWWCCLSSDLQMWGLLGPGIPRGSESPMSALVGPNWLRIKSERILLWFCLSV